jgi:hypothetical protein
VEEDKRIVSDYLGEKAYLGELRSCSAHLGRELPDIAECYPGEIAGYMEDS